MNSQHLNKNILIVWIALGVMLAAGGAGLVWRHWRENRAGVTVSGAPLAHAVYVWQEMWTPAVERAVAQTSSMVSGVMIFAAELRAEEGRLVAAPKQIDWPALARAARTVTLVVRADDRALRLIFADRPAAARLIARQAEELTARARAAGAHLSGGLQLDFDVPTARLGDYHNLIELLRPKLPGLELSITALPAWLGSGEFKRLVAGLSYFVLQVHWIEPPRDINSPAVLVNYARLPGWFKKAAATGVPFMVALPTYGYRIYFDAAGRYTGLSAEGAPRVTKPGGQMREVRADAAALAGVVRGLAARPPRNCLGVVWFRLPVEGDALNWSWPELRAVMAGRAPAPHFSTELRTPKPGLYEIWLANTGEGTARGEVAIPLAVRAGVRVLAREPLGGFHFDAAGDKLHGPAPAPGAARLIAWIRVATGGTSESQSITTGKVEIRP